MTEPTPNPDSTPTPGDSSPTTGSAAAGEPPGGDRSSRSTGRSQSTGRIPAGTRSSRAGGASDDPAESYLAAYLDAVERGVDPPDRGELDDAARADVEAVLALLAGGIDDPSVPPAQAETDVGASTAAPTSTSGDGDLRPLGESEFAVEHGLTRTNPDVVITGAAIRLARGAAGMSTVDVAEEMSRRGFPLEAQAVEAIEARAAHRMHPRDARLLAAVLDLPLVTIEATAEPWPSAPDSLATLRSAAAATDSAEPTESESLLVLGEDVVLRTGTGSHLGVLRCPGDAEVLDSRTYRQAAATRLTGPWAHLAGVLLVAGDAPHLALAVDALDCVARSHAPSGLTGFSRLAQPESIAEAVASYDRAYAIDWSDPSPLEGLAARPEQAARTLSSRKARLADKLDDEARRSRQSGKRPAYAAAARWLRAAPSQDITSLLDDLARADPDEARHRLAELAERSLA
jgi:hypothetical protein